MLSLAAVQVACEESEVVLLEVFGASQLKRIHDAHYITNNPRSALGKYFDAASSLRFDPLEL